VVWLLVGRVEVSGVEVGDAVGCTFQPITGIAPTVESDDTVREVKIYESVLELNGEAYERMIPEPTVDTHSPARPVDESTLVARV
jgi:hypothetical protein